MNSLKSFASCTVRESILSKASRESVIPFLLSFFTSTNNARFVAPLEIESEEKWTQFSPFPFHVFNRGRSTRHHSLTFSPFSVNLDSSNRS